MASKRKAAEEAAKVPSHIAGVPLALAPTPRLDERWDLYYAWEDTGGKLERITRVLAAALGLCWPQLREQLVREHIVYAGDVSRFGGDVVNYLLSVERPERPLPGWSKPTTREINAAGRKAFDLCKAWIIDEQMIADQEAFSAAPGGELPSSSSTSSAPGAEGFGSASSTPETPRG